MFDIEEAEQEAATDVMQQREASLAKQLEAMRKRKRKLVDPLQFEMSIQAEDLASYEPSLGWEMGPVTQKQLEALERYGIFPDEIECAGKAGMEGLATPKQIRFLESRGFQHVGTWQFDAANKMISRISYNNWRIPEGVVPSTYTPGATL